jgi:PAS domain S-box-containing protein
VQTDLGKLVLEESPDAIIATAPDGRTLFWSRGAEALFGYPASEAVNRLLRDLIVPEDRVQEEQRVLDETLQLGQSTRETIRRSKDGLLIHVDVTMKAVRGAGGATDCVLSTEKDVTHLKVLRGARLDRFLATMSHELRSPLNAVIGFTGTLLMKLPGPLTAEQERQLKLVQGGARHLLSLINDLLELARIESGRMELKPEPTRCAELVEAAADSLRPLAEGSGLTLEVVPAPEDPWLRVDRRTLNQIVLNLLYNAIQFTERGGVRIRIARAVHASGNTVEISVEDTGVGIRAEDQPKLFSAFSRLDRSRRRSEGSGLGLHLSQKLAEALGGRILVHSEFGKGSTFTLVVPDR